MATKVKLRQKSISGNKQSLYLDFHPPIPHPKPFFNKRTKEMVTTTRREFLGMYLHEKTKNPLDKIHNKETLDTAEQIRQKRENQLNKPEIYTGYELEQLRIRERGELNFVPYFKALAEKRSGGNRENWNSVYNYLDAFTNGNLKFTNLDEKFCNDFKDYLLNTKLSKNSAASYFNKVKAATKKAYKDGYLPNDLSAKVDPIKQDETQRNFLTFEELNRLANTKCENPQLKRAALFSALTGLRFSDIQKLIWSELEYIEGNGYFIQFKQQKTNGVEMMPISEQAYGLLGERQEPKDKVFEGFKYSHCNHKHFSQWIGLAGISKHITFHCFRHTYATLQLSQGTDIYTVSKMLGHRELKTTQIYAKIIDKTKRAAANRIKLDM
jgi:integrase